MTAAGTTTPLADLLASVNHPAPASGCLHVVSDDHTRGGYVYFTDGKIYAVHVTGFAPRVGLRFLTGDLITDSQYRDLLDATGGDPRNPQIGNMALTRGLIEQPLLVAVYREILLSALAAIASWASPDGKFREGATTDQLTIPPVAIDAALAALDKRASRWQDLWATISDDQVETCVPRRTAVLAHGGSLSREVRAVYAAIDGRRTVDLVAGECGLTRFEIGHLLKSLTEMNLVTLRRPAAIAPPEPVPGEVPAGVWVPPVPEDEAAPSSSSTPLPDCEPVSRPAVDETFVEPVPTQIIATPQAQPPVTRDDVYLVATPHVPLSAEPVPMPIAAIAVDNDADSPQPETLTVEGSILVEELDACLAQRRAAEEPNIAATQGDTEGATGEGADHPGPPQWSAATEEPGLPVPPEPTDEHVIAALAPTASPGIPPVIDMILPVPAVAAAGPVIQPYLTPVLPVPEDPSDSTPDATAMGESAQDEMAARAEEAVATAADRRAAAETALAEATNAHQDATHRFDRAERQVADAALDTTSLGQTAADVRLALQQTVNAHAVAIAEEAHAAAELARAREQHARAVERLGAISRTKADLDARNVAAGNDLDRLAHRAEAAQTARDEATAAVAAAIEQIEESTRCLESADEELRAAQEYLAAVTNPTA